MISPGSWWTGRDGSGSPRRPAQTPGEGRRDQPGNLLGCGAEREVVCPSGGELIRNTFAVTKSGVDRASAYVVSSQKLYRIDAGGDDQPYKVWSAPYDTIGTTKDGQYELGSGTSPTVLGQAITSPLPTTPTR